jgi:hypothetical protein
MSRFARLSASLLLPLCVALAPAVASAQQPGAGPPMPIGLDLAKVPVGSWADYNMSVGQLAKMKMRMALVSKGATGSIMETTVEGEMLAPLGGKMVMQVTMGPGVEKDGNAKKLVMQVGTSDPMEMPLDMTGAKQFTKPNPKTLLKSETITVAAGTFKTKHYRDKSAKGEKVDFWISEDVPPLGLVKIEAEQKGNPQIKGSVTLELAAKGADAKALITKPAKPFDQATFMQQMTGGRAGGGAPGAGKAPASAPAPAAAPAPKK